MTKYAAVFLCLLLLATAAPLIASRDANAATNVSPVSIMTNVCINEFMADPDWDWDGDGTFNSAKDEWIELYNPHGYAVSLKSWNVTDPTKRYSLSGRTIDAYGHLTLFGNASKISLNNGGDTIYLYNATDDLVDTFQYYSSRNNVSTGRLPDGGDRWTSFYEPTINASNGQWPDLVINEVLIDPVGADTGQEWVELYNNGTTVNVTEWIITTQDSDEFVFPSFTMPPKSYLVVYTTMGMDDYDFSDGEGAIYMKTDEVMFTNTGDDILLMDLDRNGIDYISYGLSKSIDPIPADLSWDGTYYDPVMDRFNGTCSNPNITLFGTGKGSSLALKRNGVDTDSVSDWVLQPPNNETKGRDNAKIYCIEMTAQGMEHNYTVSEIYRIDLTIKNIGNMPDVFDISVASVSANWNAVLDQSTIPLAPGTSTAAHLDITAPDDVAKGNICEIGVLCQSRNLPIVNSTLVIECVIPAVDLYLDWAEMTVDGEEAGQSVMEGQEVKVKAYVSNLGQLDSGPFNVTFYLDSQANPIGSVHYTYCKPKYDKAPSVILDTLHLSGNHTIIMVTDPEDDVHETTEANNIRTLPLNVTPTAPNATCRQLLLTRVYYNCHSGLSDEFVEIYNPTPISVNISGWQVSDLEGGAFFPDNTIIQPLSHLLITKNAEELLRQTGELADFTYREDSDIPGPIAMDFAVQPLLANDHDEVLLLTNYRHVIDCVIWGDSIYSGDGWSGPQVPKTDYGAYMKRQGHYYDSNTSSDWVSPRAYGLGQTDLGPFSFSTSDVTAFVEPDCGYGPVKQVIDGAMSSILICSYTLDNPGLADALVSALGRGVEVSILLEGNPVKAAGSDQALAVNRLSSAGASVLQMISNHTAGIYSRYDLIDAKYLVSDNRTVVITSENFAVTGMPEPGCMGNRGWGAVVNSTPLAGFLTELFLLDSRPDSGDVVEVDLSIVNGTSSGRSKSYYEPAFSAQSFLSPTTGTLIAGPDNAQEAVMNLLDSAKVSVQVELTDISLTWSDGALNPILDTLLQKAQSGVDVSVLLDAGFVNLCGPYQRASMGSTYYLNLTKTDNLDAVEFINAYARENDIQTLEARLAYLGGMAQIHNKGIIVDGKTVLISSMDWNEPSLRWNRELGIVINNPDIAQYFLEAFNCDWERSLSTKERPSGAHAGLLITQVYYDSFLPYDPDEFLAIYNPTGASVDLGGWYLTDQDSNYSGFEAAVMFPKGAIIQPKQELYVAKNALCFKEEMGMLPDYEFFSISDVGVGHLDSIGGEMTLANNGDEMFLKDSYHRIVDVVCWGDSEYIGEGWLTKPAPDMGYGRILWRNADEDSGRFVDTDGYADWMSLSHHYPGQTDMPLETFVVNGTMTAFVSPDCSCDALAAWLNTAQSSVLVNVYEFQSTYLMGVLVNLSLRGVDVRVFIDGEPVGGVTDECRYVAKNLYEAGCDVRFWISNGQEHIYKRYRFDHAKYAVVDNASCAVMSENWKDTGIPQNPQDGNRGWGVIVEDPQVAGYLSDVFFQDFDPARNDSHAYGPTDDEYGPPSEDYVYPYYIPQYNYLPRFGPQTFSGPSKVTSVLCPDTTLRTKGSIIGAINSATTCIDIEQLTCDMDWSEGKNMSINWSDPENYYLNWEDGESYHNAYMNAVIDAARRGVGIRMLLDGTYEDLATGFSNGDTVEYLNRIASLEGLNLSASLIYNENYFGYGVFSKVHNKGMVIDSRTVLVSSINWALGSVAKNRETGLLIENEEMARYYTSVFEFDWGLQLAWQVYAYSLYSDMHEIENGTNTGFIIRLTNNLNDTLDLDLSIIWGGSEITTDAPNGFTGDLDNTTIHLEPNETKEVVLFVTHTGSISTPINQSVGIRAKSGELTADLLFVNILVHNSTWAPENNTKPQPEKETLIKKVVKTNYSIVAILAIVLMVVVLILVALARDKVKQVREQRRRGQKTVDSCGKGTADSRGEDTDELRENGTADGRGKRTAERRGKDATEDSEEGVEVDREDAHVVEEASETEESDAPNGRYDEAWSEDDDTSIGGTTSVVVEDPEEAQEVAAQDGPVEAEEVAGETAPKIPPKRPVSKRKALKRTKPMNR